MNSIDKLKQEIETYMIEKDPEALKIYEKISKIWDSTNTDNSMSLAAMRLMLDIYEHDWRAKVVSDQTINYITARTRRKFNKFISPVKKEKFMSKLAQRSSPFDTNSLLFYCRTSIDPKWFADTFLNDDQQPYGNTSFRNLGSGYFALTLSSASDTKRLLLSIAPNHPLSQSNEEDWTENNDQSYTKWIEVEENFRLPHHAKLSIIDRCIFVRLAAILDRIPQYPIVHETVDVSKRAQDFVDALLAYLFQRQNQHNNHTKHPILSVPNSHVDLTVVTINEASSSSNKITGNVHPREETEESSNKKRRGSDQEKGDHSIEWQANNKLSDSEKLALASIDLPHDWKAVLDPHKNVYYYNIHDSQTTWEKPH